TLVVTEACFPLPGLELVPGIGKLAEVTPQATGEQVVVRPDFCGSKTGFDRAITNTGRKLGSGRSSARPRERWEAAGETARRCVVSNRERVERVLRRHADTSRADTERMRSVGVTAAVGTAEVGPDVRCKRRRRQTTIPVLAEVSEIRKNGEIFVADIAIKRTVEIFPISIGDCRS